jgi:formylglycine-generating enzyme required for sulfatase activity
LRGAHLTRPIVIGTPSGSRRLGFTDLPIRIGSGPNADIRVPGPVSGEILGLIGSLDERVFLQPAGSTGGALAVNGEAVAATRWLADGDLITAGALRIECRFDAAAVRFNVTYADAGYATLPPEDATVAAQGAEITPVRARAPAVPAGGHRTWRWLAYGALVVLAVAALQLFTAKAVRMAVSPAEAELSLEGSWLTINVGGSYLLRPGRYEVHMKADGYESASAPITVDDSPSQSFRFELRPRPGRLVMVAKPGVPVRVAVDGRDAAPAENGEFLVPAGQHVLRVLADRYQPFETTVEVEGRDRRQQIEVGLKPNWADVTVATQPPGAAIRVGGEPLGISPATVPVAAGTAELEVRLDGFKPWRQALTVAAGEAVTLPVITLQETDALLTVVTTPPGAAVTVDGRYRGATPLEAEVASGRAHAVMVAKPGYETVTRSMTIGRRASAVLRLDLVERLGIVRIESDPPDAELWINGTRSGLAAQELSLPALAQRIEVRKEGFAPYATEVTPTPGLPRVLQVRLLTTREAVLAAAPKAITTKQGLAMRLIEPGQFQMGTPRREQGRRANETERAVRLTRRFYIGTREVTNREFREFKPGHTSGAEKYQQLAAGEHPVVMLTWAEAAGFCNWLSDREGLPPAYVMRDGALRLAEPLTAGYRLPTEAEWEWASRYNGGGGARRYPWGEQMPPTERSGNFADQSAKGMVPNVLSSYDDGYPVTAPAGSFAASPLGLFDLGGNVAEWMSDIYTVHAAASTPVTDPLGPANGQYHVIRGSSWRSASISELRFAFRDFGDQGRLDVGFRLARYAE